MSNKFYGAIGISGGADGALDDIDGSNLADGDGSFVIETANNYAAFYELDSDSAAAQVVPTIMQPDTNGGDKRWILRGLKLSSVALYEPGTTNLLTITQSTGNVTVDNTYDTGIITFKGENTGDATLLVLDPAGSVDLYYAGTKEGETISGGFKATNSLTIAATTKVTGILDEDAMTSNSAVSLATQQSIKAYIDNASVTLTNAVTMTNKTLTSPIINTILTAAGKTGATLTEDGSFIAYYNEILTFKTLPDGVEIGTDASASTGLYIYNTGGGAAGASFYNYDHGGSMNFTAENLAGVAKTLAVFDPDDAAELYHAGVKAVETVHAGSGDEYGIKIPVGSGAYFYHSATGGTYLQSLQAGINVQIIGTATGDTSAILAVFNPDGAASLYYAGAEKAATLDDGFTIAGCLTLDEITTPTADADHGKVYTKTDNKLYFQDGAGTEKTLADYVAALDYSTTSTIVGFSAFGAKSIKIKKIGTTVFVYFLLSGTSNSTALTFTVPYTAAFNSVTNVYWASDDGTPAIGYAQIVDDTITMYKGAVAGNWTASGNKYAYGVFIYETT